MVLWWLSQEEVMLAEPHRMLDVFIHDLRGRARFEM